jgi:transposase
MRGPAKESCIWANLRRFTQEFKRDLRREVIGTSKPVKDVGHAPGVGLETLRTWVQEYREAHGGTDSEPPDPGRARLMHLERKNQELPAETGF